MGDWSELPQEILHLIAQCIDNCFDLIHFRSVCSSWRSSAPPRLRHLSLRCPLPPNDGGVRDDFRISKRCVYLLKSFSGDPPRYWLFMLCEEENGGVLPQNLFESRYTVYGLKYPRVSFDLLNCQVTALEYEHVACYEEWLEPFECNCNMEEKVGFIRVGGGEGDVVIIGTLSFKSLAMYRSVDECWTVLDTTPRSFIATASFNGKFYGVDFGGTTTVVNSSGELIRSGNELLLAELWMENTVHDCDDYYKPERRNKIRAKISKLDEEKDDWIEVRDLGDRVLFLACPSSFSCLASDIPGIRGNSIVFMEFWGQTDGVHDLYDRILVFDLAEQSVTSVSDNPQYVELLQSPQAG